MSLNSLLHAAIDCVQNGVCGSGIHSILNRIISIYDEVFSK